MSIIKQLSLVVNSCSIINKYCCRTIKNQFVEIDFFVVNSYDTKSALNLHNV